MGGHLVCMDKSTIISDNSHNNRSGMRGMLSTLEQSNALAH